MALASTGGNTNVIGFGSGASIDNLNPGTLLMWVRPNDIANSFRALAAKETAAYGSGWALYRYGTNGAQFRFDYTRATALSIYPSTAIVSANTWHFVGVTWDTSQGNSSQKMFAGSLTALAVEPSYTTQTAGSGANTDDSGQNLDILGHVGNSHSFPGRIAWVGLWNRQLTLAEVQQQQFRQFPTSGCVLFSHLGLVGTGTQPDWSGNGNTGTVTGATVGDHVPLGPLFGWDESAPYKVLAAYALDAAQGSYTLTGQDSGLTVARLLTAAQGSYSLTGLDAGLLAARLIDAAQGTYTLSGQNASLLVARLIAAEQGTYSLTGQDVNLTYTPVGGYTLAAESGSYTLSGQAAGLLATRLLTAEAGAYTLTGQDAALLVGRLLAAEQGAYTVTGQDAIFAIARLMAAEAGSYTLGGQAVTLVYSGELVPVTPDTRVFVVPTEDRIYVIVEDDRTFIVQ